MSDQPALNANRLKTQVLGRDRLVARSEWGRASGAAAGICPGRFHAVGDLRSRISWDRACTGQEIGARRKQV